MDSASKGVDVILIGLLVVGDRIKRHVFFGFSRSNSVSRASCKVIVLGFCGGRSLESVGAFAARMTASETCRRLS